MTYRAELIQVAAVALAAIHDLDLGETGGEDQQLWDSEVERLYQEVLDERSRQEEKWGSQHRSRLGWLGILMEEVGEAAKEVIDKELIS